MRVGSILRSSHRMEKTYENALLILKSRVRPQRPTRDISLRGDVPQTIPIRRDSDFRGTPSIIGMSKWLQWLGHDDKDISRLNIIHVAGTKGKGSTCAFAESFLRAHGQRTGFPQKTGMYTSPHLLSPEERIRINFQPISRDLLTKYFFEVYETLKEKSPPEEFGRVPRYLQLWALVSFHTFLRERIDVAIVETHHGGEYDATNFIQHPAATVIAKLGMDHIAQLGPTIENIAWHKAGIFKPGAPAFSTFQAPSLAKVLETRAREKGVQLKFVSDETDLPDDTLKLTSHVQRQNAALALAAVESVLDRRGLKLTRDDVEVGAQQFSWPGRFQIINDDAQKWFLDGAHNDISVREAARWFADAHILLSREHNPALRVLIWSQISDQRESLEVLEILARTLKEYNVPIQHVIFSTYNEHEGSGTSSRRGIDIHDLWQQYSDKWRSVDPDARIYEEPTIDSAMLQAQELSASEGDAHILLTGSQYLIGGALRILQRRIKI